HRRPDQRARDAQRPLLDCRALGAEADDQARDDTRPDAWPVDRALQRVADHDRERALEGVVDVARVRECVGYERARAFGRAEVCGGALWSEGLLHENEDVLELADYGDGRGSAAEGE